MKILSSRSGSILAAISVLVIAAAFPGYALALSTSWTASSLNLPTGVSSTELLGVSCKETTACTSVGKDSEANGGAFGETYNGSGWNFASSLVRNPGGGSNKNGVLNDVFCVKATTCMAVGSVGAGGHPVPISEAQSGSSWTATVISIPSGSERAELNGVNCKTESECFAAGYKMVSGDDKMMVMSRSGGVWSAMPGVFEGTNAALKGIDCAYQESEPKTTCIAVGSYVELGIPHAILQRWDGKSWTSAIAPTPSSSISAPVLNDVSCTSPVYCLAVGTYKNSEGKQVPFTDEINGTTISVTSTQPPMTGASEALGLGVSCVTTTECWVVGEQKVGTAPLKPWGARWNGKEWAAGTFELAPTSEGAQLRDVSCAAISTCKAVGWSSFGGTHVAVVENLHP